MPSYNATDNLNDLAETFPSYNVEPVSNLGPAMVETRRTFKAVILKEHNADGTHSYLDGAVLKAASVTADKFAAGAVAGASLGDGSVTTNKLADANVTTVKIADANITAAKIAAKVIGVAKLVGAATARLWVTQADLSVAEVTPSGDVTMTAAGVFTYVGASQQKAIAIFADVETTGTDGGTFTQGAWQVRSLNSELIDSSSLFNLSGNVITLATAGTYWILARAVGNVCGRHQIRLRDVTGTPSTIIAGMPVDAIAEQTISMLECVVTLNAGQTQKFQLEHQCQTTRAIDGFGKNTGFGENNIFSQITFIKLA